jgi:hypothetical protein
VSFNVTRKINAVRKPRRCWWCGTRIEVGQPARRIVGVWEGDFGSCYWHPECDEAFEKLSAQGREDLGVDEPFDEGLFNRGTTEFKR